jgi:hypothetical protein
MMFRVYFSSLLHRRDGQPPPRNSWGQLLAVRFIRVLQAHRFTFPTPVSQGDRHCRRNGWSCKCHSCQSRFVVPCIFSAWPFQHFRHSVEMFKVRMQGQYGAATDKRLRDLATEMWRDWGFRKGVMRGYWVLAHTAIPVGNLVDQCPGHCRQRDTGICRVCRPSIR